MEVICIIGTGVIERVQCTTIVVNVINSVVFDNGFGTQCTSHAGVNTINRSGSRSSYVVSIMDPVFAYNSFSYARRKVNGIQGSAVSTGWAADIVPFN